jgi:hypothetical protein
MTDLITPYLANDKFRTSLRSTWIATPADTSLLVTSIPTNVPTIVVVGWETAYETVFTVTGTSGTNSSDYALTGVTRVKGANANIPENTPVNCLNNEEFFNQYGTAINDVIDATNDAIVVTAVVTVGIQVFDAANSTYVKDGAAFFRVPVRLNGMDLISCAATVYTAGTTGNLDIQIRNKTDSVDMLSTKMRVETTETDTSTSAQPGVIDTTKDDVATGDVLAIDIDSIQTTAALGLYVEMRFELPA